MHHYRLENVVHAIQGMTEEKACVRKVVSMMYAGVVIQGLHAQGSLCGCRSLILNIYT